MLFRSGVRGGELVCRLPVPAFTTPPHLRPLQLQQVRARTKARSRATSKIKVKGCDEGPGLRRASATSGKLARFPRVAGSVSAAAVCEVVRSVPHGRVVSPMGTAPVSGGQVRAAAVGRAGGGCQSANLTPGHRHCRRSPADATEGNEPKTDRKKSNRRDRRRGLGGAAAGEEVAAGRWAAGRRHARVRYAATNRPRSQHSAADCRHPPARTLLSASISLGGQTSPRPHLHSHPPAQNEHPRDCRAASTQADSRTRQAAGPAPQSFVFLRLIFGSFPSVASAGLRLQRRWPGVKFALSKPQLTRMTASART